MFYIRRGAERGLVDLGWLQSQHSFSFGHYYHPEHMGISVLRVINDDKVKPGAGFDTHSHRDMEIISYVIDGALEHKDSMGNTFVVPAGEIQRMSAGSGITHSEYNASTTEPVNFLQIWIKPDTRGIVPSYEQKAISQQGALTPIVTPDGSGESLSIQQNASIFRLELEPGECYTLTTADRLGYLHIISGQLQVNDKTFVQGDAFALSTNDQLKVTAAQQLQALWFDLPA